MIAQDKCPIWGTEAPTGTRDYGDKINALSPRAGGEYDISTSTASQVAKLSPKEKAILTTWLIDQRRLGVGCPTLRREELKEILVSRPLSPQERADRLLLWLQKSASIIGARTPFSMPDAPNSHGELERLAWTESTQPSEVRFLGEALEKRGWIEIHTSPGGKITCSLTLEGFSRLREIETQATDSKQAFVAMWFSNDTKKTRSTIKKAVEDAGYEPRIIDEKPHNNKIDDEIIAEIRRSRFLVADFTHGKDGMRGGVYYEAGFARGLGLEVISTCRQDLLDNNKIHFDTRQYNHIGWRLDQLDDFRKALAVRISATMGDGPKKK